MGPDQGAVTLQQHVETGPSSAADQVVDDTAPPEEDPR